MVFAQTTNTPTNTPTPTDTYTITPTFTGTLPTITNTATQTATGSKTNTFTPTATNTPTNTPTWTITSQRTSTPTSTPTNSPIYTGSATPTNTVTNTLTATPVGTPLIVTSQFINNALPATVAAGGATISMPANTLSQSVTMTISEYAASSAPINQGALQVSFMPDVYLIDSAGLEPQAGMSVTITLPYNPANIPTGYTAADLTISYFNGTNWVTLTGTVNTVNDTITIITNHFSWWAVVVQQHTPTPTPGISAGNGSKPVLYPNPVKDSGPVKIQLNLMANSGVKLQICTTSFRTVRDVTIPQVLAGAYVTLDLVDKANAPLANGLYYVEVTTNQGKSILKLLILR